jgi:hypothetical protein
MHQHDCSGKNVSQGLRTTFSRTTPLCLFVIASLDTWLPEVEKPWALNLFSHLEDSGDNGPKFM